MIPVAENVARIIADVEVGEGARLSILRRRFGKTLAEAAAGTGIHEHVLSEMERELRSPVAVEYEQWINAIA